MPSTDPYSPRGHRATATRPAHGPGTWPSRRLSLTGLMYGSRWAFTCAAALAWCAMAANLAVPRTVDGVLAAFMHDEPVIGPVARLTALTLVSCASQAGCGRLLARAGERLVLDLRGRITHHVLRLPLPDANARGVGDVSARIIYDALQV